MTFTIRGTEHQTTADLHTRHYSHNKKKIKKNGKQLLSQGQGACLVGEICQSSSRIPGEEHYLL